MTLLYDHAKKTVVNVPEEQVSTAIASGAFAFRKNVRIPVISPEGEVGSIDATEAPEAFRNGFVFQTRQMSEDLTKTRIESARAEAFDAPVTAAAAGIARGLSLGLSDVALRAAGAGDEALALQQYNPTASTVGEVVGGIGASVAAAPATLALSGATAAKLGGGAIAKIAGVGTAMGVEGAVQSAGSVLSQAALGDPALTTDSALMQIGLGAALSGGLGAFGKGASETISSTLQAIRNSALPGATADVVGKAYAKVAGITKGLDKLDADEVTRIFTKDRTAVVDMIDNPVKFEAEAIDAVAKTRAIGDVVAKATMDAREAERGILKKVANFKVNAEAAKLASQIDDAVKTMKKKPAYYDGGSVGVAEQIASDMRAGLKRAKSTGDVHELVHNTRRAMDDYLLDFGSEISPGKARATENLFRSVRGKFQQHLIDENLYLNYANRYRDINAAYNGFSTIKKEFDKLFTRKIVDASGSPVREIDKAKVLDWFRNPENLVKMRKEVALDDLAESIKKLSSAGSPTGTPSQLTQIVDDAVGSIDRIRDIRGKALLMGRLESMTGKSLMGGLGGATAGMVFGGPVGSAAGYFVGTALSNPKSTLRILQRIENLGRAGQQKVQNQVQSVLTQAVVGAAKGTAKFGGGTFKRITAPALVQILAPDDAEGEADYDSARKVLDGLDGLKLDQRLTNSNPMLDDVTPAVYAELHQRAVRASEFVRSKFPGLDGSDMFGSYRDLSIAEKKKIDTYVDAAFRPERALEELATDAPDPRVFEALGAVYPAMYDHLQKTAMMTATDKHSTLTYKQKLKLGLAFGLPTTPSLSYADIMMSEPVGMASAEDRMQARAEQRPPQGRSAMASVKTTEKALGSLATQTEKLG